MTTETWRNNKNHSNNALDRIFEIASTLERNDPEFEKKLTSILVLSLDQSSDEQNQIFIRLTDSFQHV